MIYLRLVTLLILSLSLSSTLKSQRLSSNGWTVPVGGPGAPKTIKVMYIFAEVAVDVSNTCTSVNIGGDWPGSGAVPTDADNYFNSTLPLGGPTSEITKRFYEGSYGDYIVLGDYLDQVITVNCSDLSLTNGTAEVLDQLEVLIDAGQANFGRGSSLSEFDQWTTFNATGITDQKTFWGTSKANSPNGKIDVLLMFWRNNPDWSLGAGNGEGLQPRETYTQIGAPGVGFTGCDNKASFGVGLSGHPGRGFVVQEYFHAMFGSNEWHTVGGRGKQTLVTVPHSFGITSQSGTQSIVINGYERYHMGWKGWKLDNLTDQKSHLISVMDGGVEVNTDIPVPVTDVTFEFTLRDFIRTGDAIRIKLPHINWTADGDVKNQYLWLENHQKISEFDHSAVESICSAWSPGVIAYLQIGKDFSSGTREEIWPGEFANSRKPNTLASYLYPLTAEGNWDYNYRTDLSLVASSPISDLCNFGARHTPTDIIGSIENPLTGYSDLFNAYNYNGDQELHSTGDAYPPGYSKAVGSSIDYDYHQGGDGNDAFTSDVGRNEISMGTNPSPIPVYTFTSKPASSGTYHQSNPNQKNQSYENRDIWLNGLSIEFISETPNTVVGGNDIKVRLNWNQRDISNDVRWCGNIKLSPNEFGPLVGELNNPAEYSLNLKPGKIMTLDRGQSPTQHIGVEQIAGEWVFTDPTEFTCLPNSYFHMESNAAVVLKNGTTFRVQQGAKLELHEGCRFIVKAGCKLILEQGAELVVANTGIVEIQAGGILEYDNSTIVLGGNKAVLEISGKLKIADNATFTFQGNSDGCGYVRFSNSSVFSPNILAGTNSKFELNNICSGGKVLEIQSSVVYPEAGLQLFSIQNGIVEFRGSTTFFNNHIIMSPFFNFTDVSFNSIGSANGRLTTVGQSIAIIRGCTFNRTYISANLFGKGNSLSIINTSILSNPSYGLYVYGGGVNLDNVLYKGNGKGMVCTSLEHTSRINDSQFIFNGEYGMQFQYGSENLVKLTNTNVDNNDIGGIYGDDISLKIRCGSVSKNHETFYGIGINLFNNSTLDMSSTSDAGYVDLSLNRVTIQANNAKMLQLDLGFNNLEPTSTTGLHPSIIGTLQFPTGPAPVLFADNNRWGNLSNSPPGDVFAINLQNAISGIPITVTDANPGNIASCATFPDPCAGFPSPCKNILLNFCSTCPVITTSDFSGIGLNVAISTAIDNMEIENNSGNDLVAIDQFHQILSLPLDRTNPSVDFLINQAYTQMKVALGSAFGNGKITENDNITQFHASVQQVLDIQDTLSGDSLSLNNIKTSFFLNLDKAHTYRLAGKRNIALQVLKDADSCPLSDEDRSYLNRRISLIEAEILVLTGQEPIENFTSLLEATNVFDLLGLNLLDSSATIDSSASIGDGVSIGQNTFVGSEVSIGDNVTIGNDVMLEEAVALGEGSSIGDNTTIEMNTSIGEHTTIASNVKINKDAVIGDNVIIEDNVHISKDVVIGDNVTLRSGTFLKKDVEVSDGACLESNVRVGSSTTIGTNAFVGEDSKLGNNVLIGDESIVEEDVTLGNGAETGTGSVIEEGTTVGVNASVCDGESTTGSVSNNGTVGSCTSPTDPTDPVDVVHDCAFALTRAELHQNFLNGFGASTNGSDTLCIGTDIKFVPNKFSNQVYWDFGDCSTSTDRTPVHSYSKPGIYVIKLVQDFDCSFDTVIGAISVYPNPLPSFTLQASCDSTREITISRSIGIGDFSTSLCIQPDTACTQAPLDTTRLRIRYNWDFGTGAFPPVEEFFGITQILSGVGADFVLPYPVNSQFSVSLVTTLQLLDLHDGNWKDLPSCSNSFSKILKTTELPASNFATDELICIDHPAQFANLTLGGNPPFTVVWEFGDGQTSTAENPANNYGTSGEYNTSLIVMDQDGCSDTALQTVIVSPPLEANFAFEVDGLALTLIDLSSNAVAYLWDLGDGSTSEHYGPYHRYQKSGTYTVCQAISNLCATDTLCQEILVGPTTFQKVYGGTGQDQSRNIITTQDGGFAITGFTTSFGAGNRDVYVLKLDASGVVEWSKTFGGTGVEEGWSIEQTKDGGYIIGGETRTFGQGGQDLLLIRLDAGGNLLWKKAHGLSAFELTRIIRETADGGFASVGYTNSTGSNDFLLARFDNVGNLLWSRAYGENTQNEFPLYFDITDDGGYIITGYRRAGGPNWQVYLLKADSLGNFMWAKTYAGVAHDLGFAGQQMGLHCNSDKGFIILGQTNSFGAGSDDMLLIRTDSMGNLLWSKTYGGSGVDVGYTVIQKEEGGFVLAGTTTSFGSGSRDLYLLNVDSMGNLLSSRTYGGPNIDAMGPLDNSAQILPDGGIIIGGSTNSFGFGSDDLYIIKTDSSGISGCNQINTTATIVNTPSLTVNNVFPPTPTVNLISITPPLVVTDPATLVDILCPLPQLRLSGPGNNQEGEATDQLTQIQEKVLYEGYRLTNYPNPFREGTTIAAYIPVSFGPSELFIYDIVGNMIQHYKLKSGHNFIEVQPHDLNHGIYFYSLVSNGQKIETRKMIHLK